MTVPINNPQPDSYGVVCRIRGVCPTRVADSIRVMGSTRVVSLTRMAGSTRVADPIWDTLRPMSPNPR